jgi:hypothetical protein
VDGNTVLYGAADPVAATGANGNFFINTTSHFMFGPKSAGAWPAGASMIGPEGPTGQTGAQGSAGATGTRGSLWYEGIGPPPTGSATETWNAADLSAVTLTNNNLTATGTAAGGVRSTAGLSSGKLYYEGKITAIQTNSLGIGICTAGANLATINTAYANAAAVNRLGIIFLNGSNSGVSLGMRAVNDIIGLAVDLTARLIWFRVAPAGNWNASGTANPATGAGGISISVLTGAVFCLFSSGANGDAVTANLGASAFSGAVPSGFSAGWFAPAISGLLVGDNYLNGSNGDVYTLTATGWGSPVGNIRGPQGPAGAGSPSTVPPIMDGVATVGISTNFSREDHVHPSDTSRAPLASPALTGTPTVPTAAPATNTTQAASTAFVTAAVASHPSVRAIRMFNASGTYTPTVGMTTCIIEMVGAGAGGNGYAAQSSFYDIGGGGGSGAYARKFATAAQIGASQAVTVGGGGPGGPGTTNSAGYAGGDSSVGVLCVAKGAPSNGSGLAPGGGAVLAGCVGDFTAPGSPGQFGVQAAQGATVFTGGAGGSSMLGPGGMQTQWTATVLTGNNALGYGGGGSGGSFGQATGGVGGGNGGNGVVMITEF